VVNRFFRQQLAAYADHHRDARNCIAHFVGIPLLFLAVILPFALWRIEFAGVTLTMAPLMTALGVAGWLIIDRFVGLAMIVAVTPLVALAQWFALRFGADAVLATAIGLLAIGAACLAAGHTLFERRRPALADDFFQAFIGPMFFVAKALVALGFRPDLADALNGRGDDLGEGSPLGLTAHAPSGRRDQAWRAAQPDARHDCPPP
jgi:uncharacterized membrane protein YGL010W